MLRPELLLLIGDERPGDNESCCGGQGSQINAPIAVLIWLMITPMMMKVDFGAVRDVGRRPTGLLITLL